MMGREDQEGGSNKARSQEAVLSPEAETQNILASEGIQLPGCSLCKYLAEMASGAVIVTICTWHLISIYTKAAYGLAVALGAMLGTAGLCPGPASPFCLLIHSS